MTQQPLDPQLQSRLIELLEKGTAAADGGDVTSAEAFFREAASLAPTNALVLHSLGLLLFNAKRLAEAEQVLIAAAGHGALPASLLVLGKIFEDSKRYQDALRCFEGLLKADPRKYKIHMKIGELKGLLGDKAGELESYKRALEVNPGDPAAAFKYADGAVKAATALGATDRDGSVRMMEEALAVAGANPTARSLVLFQLVQHKEWNERIKRGQAPYHASSVDELFFKYAQEHMVDLERTNNARLAAKPADEEVRIGVGIARFCLGNRRGAEAMFQSAPKHLAGHILETVKFEPAFYDELRAYSDEDLERDLPPLETVASMPGNATGIVYLSCNFSYFHAFALPMVVSLRERSPSSPVHVHIMDAKPKEAAFAEAFMKNLSLQAFAISVERPGLRNAPVMEARSYYHAVRFIRFYRHLKSYGSPLWLMDVDAVINRDLSNLMTQLPGHDVAVRVRPGRLEPWNQFNACMVGANTTPASLEYFRLIAAYTAYFYQRKSLRWGIDQLAMYGVFADMQDRGAAPSLTLLGERDVDYEYNETGYVWPNSGAAKLGHLERIKSPGAPPAGPLVTKFDNVFEHYWQQTVQLAARMGMGL